MQAQQQLVGAAARHRLFLFSPALFQKSSLNDCSFSPKIATTPFQLQAFLPRSRLHSPIQVSATLQENIAESSAGTDLVKVKFVLQRRCEFGQQFNLVGDDDSFGAWDPEASIPMQWSEGHVWTTEMEVSVGKRVEYKMILMGGEGVLDWQPGPNRVLEPLQPLSPTVVLEIQWGEDDSYCEYDIQTNRSADMESLSELAAPGETLSLMDSDGVAFPSVDSDSILEEKTVDLCEETAVDGVTVETLTEVQKQLAADMASDDAKADTEREPTVLEKDLQWFQKALSMLWSSLTQIGNNIEV